MKILLYRVLLTAFVMSICTFLSAAAQEKVTLSGYLKNKASGEGLIGASIGVKELTGVGASYYQRVRFLLAYLTQRQLHRFLFLSGLCSN